VRDQQRLPPRYLHYEPLVPFTVIVIGDQSYHVAGIFDPAIVVRPFVAVLYVRIILP
jgi:hypothetical protein